MKKFGFTVIFERDDAGRFRANCPALQGCQAEGYTLSEAHDMIEEAIRLLLVDSLERGETVRQEVAVSHVTVTV